MLSVIDPIAMAEYRLMGYTIEDINGDRFWYLNGKHHREDGPAVEYSNGNRYWYFNGKRHREDGPAVECPDGNRSWYLNGDYIEKMALLLNVLMGLVIGT